MRRGWRAVWALGGDWDGDGDEAGWDGSHASSVPGMQVPPLGVGKHAPRMQSVGFFISFCALQFVASKTAAPR
jgi:hypothetical protein